MLRLVDAKRDIQLSLRYNQHEIDCIDYWHAKAKSRTKDRAERAEVMRELFGLEPPDLLTKDEIEAWRNGKTPMLTKAHASGQRRP